jgi:hypothetical protein
MRRARGAAATVLLAVSAACAGAAAAPEVTLDPIRVSAPEESSPLVLAIFLVGCWRAELDGVVVEEVWGLPAGGVMLGWSRTTRPDRPVQYEYLRIEVVDGEILYRPSPAGRPSEHDFRLTESAPGALTFEAPEHDFPRRIQYRRLSRDALDARIDGGAGSAEFGEWRYQRASCPEG